MTGRDDIPAAERREIKRLWVEHGGGQHGPRVETYTIPEEAFWRFMSAALALRPAPHEAVRQRAVEEATHAERDRLFTLFDNDPRHFMAIVREDAAQAASLRAALRKLANEKGGETR